VKCPVNLPNEKPTTRATGGGKKEEKPAAPKSGTGKKTGRAQWSNRQREQPSQYEILWSKRRKKKKGPRRLNTKGGREKDKKKKKVALQQKGLRRKGQKEDLPKLRSFPEANQR